MDLEHIDRRLDRIEGKLDDHLDRMARAEEGLASVRGHIKVILSVALAVFSAAVTALLKKLSLH